MAEARAALFPTYRGTMRTTASAMPVYRGAPAIAPCTCIRVLIRSIGVVASAVSAPANAPAHALAPSRAFYTV